MRRTVRVACLSLAVALLIVPVPSGGTIDRAAETNADGALRRLAEIAGGRLEAHFAPELDAYDFVRATGSSPLARDDAKASPVARARAFLARHGAILGLSAAERASIRKGSGSVLAVAGVERDEVGATHVRFVQRHRGVDVFGAEVRVHLDGRGVTAVNGAFVPGVRVDPRPSSPAGAAVTEALSTVGKALPGVDLKASVPERTVFRLGLLERQPGATFLAWTVEVTGAGVREQVIVDATSGAVIRRLPMIHQARDRVIYTPVYMPRNPSLFVVRSEDGLPNPLPPVENLYRYAGQVYDLFAKSFGRDSYDGEGASMRSVYLINHNCPNAYWNGVTTNYCPGFDLDDVVAHEWGHAFTEHTHQLVYFCEPGALNESYSDIWGETVDLLNGEDGVGGANNDRPYPDGQRWLVGEDLGQPVQEVLLRDMWDPERLSAPSKVSSEAFQCGTSDGGGVHTNSGVSNHAYAMLVDGKTFNGQTVRGIGLTKAAHIYYRAMAAYQTATTKFGQHEQALKASCRDLLGLELAALMTGEPSGERLTDDDCAQVEKVARAVEFSTPPSCGFKPLLAPGAPPVCPGGKVFSSEDFEDGLKGWTLESQGEGRSWPNLNWEARGSLPQRRAGTAAFIEDPVGGTCFGYADRSGTASMTSPPLTIPADAGDRLRLRFDHWVALESGDTGTLSISVEDGEFAPLPAESYLFNGPTDGDDWTGADGGEVQGSWGTTVADLSGLVAKGQSVRLRFDFTMDCADGFVGWFVDNIKIYDCPLLPAPEVPKLGGDYASPDRDGSFTLAWKRPENAAGPDLIQSSTASCVPHFVEDAENGLDRWEATKTGSSPLNLGWDTATDKPGHDGTAFAARIPEPVQNESATLTLREPVAIPARGKTVLSFADWFGGDLADIGFVEVSDGSAWRIVHASTLGALGYPTLDYPTVALATQKIDVTSYAGKAIRIRFRYRVGDIGYVDVQRLGWYVDDIEIRTDSWQDLATVSGTSYRVTGLGAGTHCFRVASSYRVRGASVVGEESGVVNAVIAAGVKPVAVKPSTANPGTGNGVLPGTGVGTLHLAGLVLIAAGGSLSWTLRRARSR